MEAPESRTERKSKRLASVGSETTAAEPGISPTRESQPDLFPAPLPSFDSTRLTQARRIAGMTKRQVAEALNVSPVSVGQWESGVQPRRYHVEALGELLDVSPEFFSSGRPYARLEVASTHFRSLRRTPAKERDRAVAFTEQVWEVANALERYVELPHVDVLGFSGGESATTFSTPQEAAQSVRRAWGVPPGPVQNMVRLLEQHGVITTLTAFAGDKTATVDAFSTSHLPRPVVVLTPDRADDIYRHRFTAAHELGHLVLHGEAEPGDVIQEREADAFAAEFLTPQSEIASALPNRMDMNRLSALSAQWGVDIDSLIYRTRELGFISEPAYRRAFQRLAQLRRLGQFAAPSVENYPGENPQLLLQAYRIAESGGLTIDKLSKQLHVPAQRLRKLIGIPDERPVLSLV